MSNKQPLVYALGYAKLGWNVLPVWSVDDHGQCRCGRPNHEKGHKAGKHPQSDLVAHGHHDATTDEATIRDWWATDPDAGIGIELSTSGLLALDIDPQNGGDESLRALEAEHGVLHSDCTAVTQGGGEHRLFSADSTLSYPGTLGAGLDLKHHGYICVAPTSGPSGIYQWEAGRSPLSKSTPAQPSPLPRLIASKARAPVDYSLTERGGVPVATAQTFDDLRSALEHVDFDDYTTWVNVGMVLKPYGENGYKVWTEWAARSDKFDASAQRRKWERDISAPHSITYRSIFRMAIDNGWTGNELAVEKKPASVLDQPIKPFTETEAKVARLHPRVLVEDYLFADLRNLIAAGGVGKTTMLLHEAVYGALGRSIWNKKVASPFTTVIITKEDSREILVARLYRMMDAMGLSASQRNMIFQRVWAIDLVGEPFKLAKFSNQTVHPHFENLDKLILCCSTVKPDRIIFDPLMSFSVGESHVNDAEQAIVEASRYIMRKIPNCAVEVVHHTGKGNARAGTTDQYSGRNGSALPDGSRMVAVLNSVSTETFFAETGITLDTANKEAGLKLSLPKLSYSAPQEDIYIHRKGYLFEAVERMDHASRKAFSEEKKLARKDETDEVIRHSLLQTLMEFSTSNDPLYRYTSESNLIDASTVKGQTKTRKKVLRQLINNGLILECTLSDEVIAKFTSKNKVGNRTTYLALTKGDG
jgi:RecA-family ATPase